MSFQLLHHQQCLELEQYLKTRPGVPSASCVLQPPMPLRQTIRSDAQPKDLLLKQIAAHGDILLYYRHTRNTTSKSLFQGVLAYRWQGSNLARTRGHCGSIACLFPTDFVFMSRNMRNQARMAQDDTATAKMVSSPRRIQSCCASRLHFRMGKNLFGSGSG